MADTTKHEVGRIFHRSGDVSVVLILWNDGTVTWDDLRAVSYRG